MTKIVIIGAGISGLLAADRLRRLGVEATVLSDEVGGAFMAGGPRFFRATDAVVELMADLKVASSKFFVSSGVVLRGRTFRFPNDLGKEDRDNVQTKLFRKMTLTDPWKRTIREASSKRSKTLVRCCESELFRKLAARAKIRIGTARKITSNEVLTDSGKLYFDFLIVTIPIWDLAGMVDFEVQEAFGTKLTVARIVPIKDPFVRFDLVFCPFTPEDFIFRITVDGDGWIAEATGDPDFLRLQGDANFLFPDGYFIDWVRGDLSGSVVTLSGRTVWPDNIAPVGRYAEADDGIRGADVLESVPKLAERWGLTCRN